MDCSGFRLKGNPDEDFAKIAQAISKACLVREPSVEAKVTSNKHLALAYEMLSPILSSYRASEVTCSKVDNAEILDFVGLKDRAWKFTFKGERVKVTVDGETFGTFDQDDLTEMRSLVVTEFEEDLYVRPGW
jgi:hypothetical protein